MIQRLSPVALVILLSLAQACASGEIKQTIDPKTQTGDLAPAIAFIADRTDEYVKGDSALTDENAAKLLAKTEALRLAFKGEVIKAADHYDNAMDVFATHDAYVKKDGKLTSLQRRTYLFSTANQRRMFNTAMGAEPEAVVPPVPPAPGAGAGGAADGKATPTTQPTTKERAPHGRPPYLLAA